MAGIALLTLLGVHSVLAFFANRYPEGQVPQRLFAANILVQLPIFWISMLLAFNMGVFSRQLVSPIWIGLGIVVGHAVFAVSLITTAVTGGEHEIPTHAQETEDDAPVSRFGLFKETLAIVGDLGGLWRFMTDNPFVLSRFMGVAFAEELIWRAGAQTVILHHTGSASVAIGITAAVFVLVHRHFFQNSIIVGLEFLGFAILLGVLYYLTGSFILIVVIHALRDIEIAYLEYLIKVEELGDETLAAQEIEQTYMPKRPAHHES